MPTTVLKKLKYPPFKPLPFFSSGKAQTLLTFFYPSKFDIKPTITHTLSLPDEDKIVLMEYRPKSWIPGDRILLLIHGLTGDYQSKYNVRMTRLWLKEGYLVIRMNLRGCGPGAGLARHPYHSGRSEDTRFVIEWLKKRFSYSPVTQVGFSLGGNITLKMAAEDGPEPSGNLDSVIAVSPPVDLHACSALLHRPNNQVFERYFVQALIKDFEVRRKHFPDIPKLDLSPDMSLLEFDNMYTAPQSGFKDAIDYYTQSSSGMLLDRITIPTLVLYAKDDPFITIERFVHKMAADNFDMIVTEHGGHLGWIGYPFTQRWMDGALTHWLNWYINHPQALQEIS